MHSASMIIEDRDGAFLLLQRGPTAPWMPCRWNLPGGHVEPGETPAQAAVRETREETNLRVKTLRPVARVRTVHGFVDLFYAKQWAGRLRLDERENVSYAWVPRAVIAQWDIVPPQLAVLRRFAAR
jgi:8-oxo-dGTP pyrophosphatase MutT (NUDIX family)